MGKKSRDEIRKKTFQSFFLFLLCFLPFFSLFILTICVAKDKESHAREQKDVKARTGTKRNEKSNERKEIYLLECALS